VALNIASLAQIKIGWQRVKLSKSTPRRSENSAGHPNQCGASSKVDGILGHRPHNADGPKVRINEAVASVNAALNCAA